MASTGSTNGGITRIGSGVVIRGNIRGDGDLDIEGRVEGSIDVDGDITLSESARIKVDGSLRGRRVNVAGAVAGDVQGSVAVVLEGGARVVGDLSAPSIGIRPGGLLRGHVSTTDEHEAVTARRDSRGAPARGRAAEPARPRYSPPARAEAKAPVIEAIEPEPETPRGRGRGAQKKAAPPPVMPSLKKGARGQIKRRGR